MMRAIKVSDALPWWWDHVNLGVVDHPRRGPRLSVVPVGDVEEEVIKRQASITVRIARMNMVVGSEWFDPGVGVVVNLPIGGERHAERPPPRFGDGVATKIVASRTSSHG